jgi:purine-binding chemotaxis protein CheW
MSESVETMANQYLTFVLDNDLYALGIASVKEVLEYMPITRVPQTQEYMRGVINVRGNAVPVIDLRLKFGLDEIQKTIDTCIIIIEVAFEGEWITLGVLVDGVEEVLEMEPESIEPAPKMGTHLNRRFIQGIGKIDDKFVILLDIKEVFSYGEFCEISETKTSSRMKDTETQIPHMEQVT